MPSFAEMITGNAMKSVADARDPNAGSAVVGGMQVGANLAIENQKNQMAQRQLQQKQQELRNAQIDKVYSFIQGAHNYQNAGDRNNYLKNVPAMASALGLPPGTIPPDALNGMGSDENMGRIAALNAQAEANLIKPEDVLKIMGDKEAFAKVSPLPPQAINLGKMATTDAFKDVLARQNAKEVAGIKTGGINERNIVSQHEHALAEISNPNSQVQKALGAAQSITNSYKAFEASGGMGAEFEQFQNQLRLNQGSSAAARSGVAERAKAHAGSLGISAQQYIQMATGQVQNVENASPELVKAMKEVGKIETQQITKQADDALTRAEKGRRGFYDEVGGYKAEDYKARINETRDQLKAINGGYGGDKKITFAGHDWTPSQLKSKIDSLKGSTDAATVKRLKEAQDAYDAGVK